MTVSLAHRGLGVADLTASARFYAGLGFREVVGATSGAVALRDGIALRNGHGVTLWLDRAPDSASPDRRRRRPMTALGLTHLNFYVRDFEATLDKVRDSGGTVAEETLIASSSESGSMAMIYCTDPDGIRVEIWSTVPYGTGGFSSAIPGIDHKFSHSGICVRNLAESVSFYEALGFSRAETFDYRDPPGQLDRMFEERNSSAIAQMMRNGPDVVELLSFLHPQPRHEEPWSHSGGRGFNLLAFHVDSPSEIADAVLGPVSGAYAEGVDPNGVRLEFAISGASI